MFEDGLEAGESYEADTVVIWVRNDEGTDQGESINGEM